jgi:hypothetical protein
MIAQPEIVSLGFAELFRGEETNQSVVAGYLLADTLRLIREYLTPRK